LSKTWHAIDNRFESGGLEQEYDGKVYEGRGAYLRLAYAMVAQQPWGVGLNNWSYWVSNRYGPAVLQYYAAYKGVDQHPPDRPPLRLHAHVDSAYAPPAHTLYGITLGETGWAGVFVFALVWLRWLHMTGRFVLRWERTLVLRAGKGTFFGLLGGMAQSYTEWQFRETSLFFLLHIVLGLSAALQPALDAREAPPHRAS